MRVFECQSQRFCFARSDDQMDVIGHETVANQGNRVQREALRQLVDKDAAMGVAVKPG
jgi:hypothetical protein